MKSGFVAVIGLPNAGKSTLVNALIGEKVSIVTSKPQTTRKRTLGILTDPEKSQIVFVDTPGVTDSKEGLNSYLRRELDQAIAEVDVLLGIIGPWEFKTKERPWALQVLEKYRGEKKIIYCATQIARTKKENRPLFDEQWKEWTGGEIPLLHTSALEGFGLLEIKEALLEVLPEGPTYFDSEIYTPQTMRDLAGETVRQKCFEFLHQEVPYGLAVKVTRFDESAPTLRIEADVIVERESHKAMVIGKGGQSLKRIGMGAREELEKMFERKVFLGLHVVVKQGWTQRPDLLEDLGYTHV